MRVQHALAHPHQGLRERDFRRELGRTITVFSNGPMIRSVSGWARLAMAVATAMSVRPVPTSSSVFRPVRRHMNRVALRRPAKAAEPADQFGREADRGDARWMGARA